MAKAPSNRFVCEACGSHFLRWSGQCADCGQWNTLIETASVRRGTSSRSVSSGPIRAIPISSVEIKKDTIIPSGIQEFDRVLGQGIVSGSVILLGGEPGIGKSTVCLQIAAKVAENYRVLYVTGEESLNQVRLRSDRLGAVSDQLFVTADTDMVEIIDTIESIRPELVILDSIQVVVHPDVSSVSGTVNQVRYCASELIKTLKRINAAGILVGHITKDGALAGPKVLEHLVDVILYFEGESGYQYRLLRSFKNRYSSTREIGVFAMAEEGLIEIPNPSGLFLDETTLKNPGSMVVPVAEGSRVFLVEVQALVVETGYGMGRRTILGVDTNRAHLLIAAVEKIVGLKLSSKDIILNIVGGYKTSEPAVDLGVVLAMFSSAQDLPISGKMGVLGEVGLTGEIRPVPQFERRIMELEKLGFDGCIVPQRNMGSLVKSKVKLVPVESLQDALRRLVAINS